MELLPLEMVEKVAEHLTPQDLAACSAVSVAWREIFNQDRVWKPHCDKDTAEYLETAVCQVEPGFRSPESMDSTVTPICRWWLCYMRENHLLNNWRRGRSVLDKLDNEFTVEDFFLFVANDYILLSRGNTVMLWHVKDDLVHLHDPFCLPFDCRAKTCEAVINDNMILITQGQSLQVYHFNSLLDQNWPLKHIFFLEETSTCALSDALKLMSLEEYHNSKLTSCIVVGNMFVAVSCNEPYLFHCWDVEQGIKLKTVKPNISSETFNKIWEIVKSENPSQNILLVIRKNVSHGYKYLFYVYNLERWELYPFSIRRDEYFWLTFPERRPIFKTAIQDKFVTFCVNGAVFIYNYLTSQLILSIPVSEYPDADISMHADIMPIGNNILICKEHRFYKIFNTVTMDLQDIKITNNSKTPAVRTLGKVIFGNLFYTTYCNEDKVWEMGRDGKITFRKLNFKYSNLHNFGYKINKSHCKILYDGSQISTFW